MKGFLKWAMYVAAGLAGLVIVAAIGIYMISNARIGKTWDVPAADIAVPTDSASLERGEHLASIMGCKECHVENLGGQLFIDEPIFATLYAPNLTAGTGGALAKYDDAGLARVIRHGINADNKSVLIMPAPEYNHLSDEDVGAIIAYLKTVPPVNNPSPPVRFGFMGRLVVALNLDPILVAPTIDHTAQRAPAPPPGPTPAYGAYIGKICSGCHGPDLAGATDPDPDARPARNLTPAGNLAAWSLPDFVKAMRTGVTPDGYQLDPTVMPWPVLARMTDVELEAVFEYLRTVPPAEPE